MAPKRKPSFQKVFERRLGSVEDGQFIVLETDFDKNHEVGLAAVKRMTDKGYSGIVLSTLLPSKDLSARYITKGVGKKKSVVDIVSGSTEVLSNLTNLYLSISKSVKKMKGKKFLFIDSLAAMQIHNNPDTLSRFMHALTNSMRENKVTCMLVSMKNEKNEKVNRYTAELCDKTVRL